MNKKAIVLICVISALASLQLACSLTDRLAGAEEGQPSPGGDADTSLVSESEGHSPVAAQSPQEDPPPDEGDSCHAAFAGSTNITEGQAFQPGDPIQAVFTLTNTGTCSWTGDYHLVMVEGDLTPFVDELALPGAVEPGETIQLEGDFTAPAQEGPYLSLWKLRDAAGTLFGQEQPLDAPLRIKVRVVPFGNPQPTPSPTPLPQQDQLTMLEDECFDFNSGAVVGCGDSAADFRYEYHSIMGGQLYKANDNVFGTYHGNEPDQGTCENDSYAPLPHAVQEDEYLCFKIETLASTIYGWMRVWQHNENGMTFDFEIVASGPVNAAPAPLANPLVETEGEQLTLLEGECFDIWNGETNSSCSGVFAGFLFEEVTKKSLQVAQINPTELSFSAAMTSLPTQSDCQDASYTSSPIWPIQETSYYCYQFVPGTTTHYGWLRPTSFNLNGLTFDYLTWESAP